MSASTFCNTGSSSRVVPMSVSDLCPGDSCSRPMVSCMQCVVLVSFDDPPGDAIEDFNGGSCESYLVSNTYLWK